MSEENNTTESTTPTALAGLVLRAKARQSAPRPQDREVVFQPRGPIARALDWDSSAAGQQFTSLEQLRAWAIKKYTPKGVTLRLLHAGMEATEVASVLNFSLLTKENQKMWTKFISEVKDDWKAEWSRIHVWPILKDLNSMPIPIPDADVSVDFGPDILNQFWKIVWGNEQGICKVSVKLTPEKLDELGVRGANMRQHVASVAKKGVEFDPRRLVNVPNEGTEDDQLRKAGSMLWTKHEQMRAAYAAYFPSSRRKAPTDLTSSVAAIMGVGIGG